MTHCRFACEKSRSDLIDGSATFTIATSRMTMNCAVTISANALQRRSFRTASPTLLSSLIVGADNNLAQQPLSALLKGCCARLLSAPTIKEDNNVGDAVRKDRRWSALALIVTAQFMVILDVAIVNVALPSIKSDLDFSQANLQWVISAYAIMFGGALLLGGRLADVLGRRRLFVAGLAVF